MKITGEVKTVTIPFIVTGYFDIITTNENMTDKQIAAVAALAYRPEIDLDILADTKVMGSDALTDEEVDSLVDTISIETVNQKIHMFDPIEDPAEIPYDDEDDINGILST